MFIFCSKCLYVFLLDVERKNNWGTHRLIRVPGSLEYVFAGPLVYDDHS